VQDGLSLEGGDVARLTGRQRQVLGLLINGQSPKEVARQLGIRPGTVRMHMLRARERVQARTTCALTARFARTGGE
jgi:DNA-binding CsgD family transcriptional regulator